MSLFKTREFWYTNCEDDEIFDQNSFVTSKLNSDSDFIITGSQTGVLRIYKPSSEINGNNNISGYKPTDLLIEKRLDSPILQVGVGKLVSGSHNLQIAILHPRQISVCILTTKEGATDHGTQHDLQKLYEHKLKRSAINFVIGPFGGSQNRDFICVQSLDGIFSFFEQETFTFFGCLPDFLLPGPLIYVKKSDSFITVTPNWHLESYSYKNLSDRGVTTSEDLHGAKKVICDWSYNLGESVVDLNHLEDNSSKENYIVVLGERNIFCLNETGKLRFMKKQDFCPVCFTTYTLNEKLITIAVSETDTLLVYQETSLKWSAQLQFSPVSIKRTFLKNIYGVIVLLSEQGALQCCYLGTEPSLFVAPPLNNKEIEFEKVEEELTKLNTIIKTYYSEDSSETNKDESEITLLISVDPHLQPCTFENNMKNAINNQMCNVSVLIQPRGIFPEVQLSIFVQKPLKVSPQIEFYSNFSEKTLLNCVVYPYETSDISSLKLQVVASYISSMGVPRIATKTTMLPLNLILESCQAQKESQHKITLNINQSLVPLSTLFPEFMDELAPESPNNAIGFKNVTDGGEIVTILVAKSTERYRLQSDSLASLNVLIEQIIYRIRRHFADVNDFILEYNSTLPIDEILAYVNLHFDARQRVKLLQNELAQHSTQFRLIQKRLITKFKVKNPTPLGNLEVLLDDTFSEILKLSSRLEEANEQLITSQIELSCALGLVINLMKLMTVPDNVLALMESALFPNIYDIEGQNWEDVLDASLCYLLRTVLAISEKDKLRAAHTSFEEIKEIAKLEKHLTKVLEKVIERDSEIGDRLHNMLGAEQKSREGTTDKDVVPIGSKFGESSSRLLSARKHILQKRAKLEEMKDADVVEV